MKHIEIEEYAPRIDLNTRVVIVCDNSKVEIGDLINDRWQIIDIILKNDDQILIIEKI